jgi:mannose-6-phosphate isomerase-like protein (cupin superfamily)
VQTVLDGRGGIMTWLPAEPIAEFNLVHFRAGVARGNHYHPEFAEYLLVVRGEGVVVWRSSPEATGQHVVHMGAGLCARCPIGLVHAFHAIRETTCMAMITKPWDQCDVPYVRVAALASDA